MFRYIDMKIKSVTVCITCTTQSGAPQKLRPIADEQKTERPLRTQETKAPHGRDLEHNFSGMLRHLGRLERHPSIVLRLRGSPKRHSGVPGL